MVTFSINKRVYIVTCLTSSGFVVNCHKITMNYVLENTFLNLTPPLMWTFVIADLPEALRTEPLECHILSYCVGKTSQ